MKNIFTFLLAVLAMTFIASVTPTETKAQKTTVVSAAKDAVLNTDTTTVTFSSVTNSVVSFTIKAVKDTGTISGRIVLQGYQGGIWQPIDSITTSASSFTSSVLSKTFPARHTSGVLLFSQYRFVIYESTMGRVKTIKGEMLERQQ
jgi:hypothetical protein